MFKAYAACFPNLVNFVKLAISVNLCLTYLPILVDNRNVLLHYQIMLLMFLSDEVPGLAVFLVAFTVDIW